MSKERPYALQLLQTQILYDIAGMLDALNEEVINFHQNWLQTVPEGIFEPLTLAITSRITILDPESLKSMPWITFTIYNDGPNPVYMMVNEEFVQTRTPLNAGENLTVNTVKPKVKKVQLFCLTGLTTSVRIFAVR